MTTVEKIVNDVNGNLKFLEIRIHTACCKRVFIVEVLPNGEYFDLEFGRNVYIGTKNSIDLALKFQNENKKT